MPTMDPEIYKVVTCSTGTKKRLDEFRKKINSRRRQRSKPPIKSNEFVTCAIELLMKEGVEQAIRLLERT